MATAGHPGAAGKAVGDGGSHGAAATTPDSGRAPGRVHYRVEAGGGGVPPDWKGGGTCWQALRPDSGTPRAFVSRLKSSWKFAGRGAAPAIVKS